MAQYLCENENVFILIDELFKGTNVMDALDGSLEVIKRFTCWKGSIFLISSHILEIANHLNNFKNITFYCFDLDDRGMFNYRLLPGLSKTRIGLKIIEEEDVLTLLEKDEMKDSNTMR